MTAYLLDNEVAIVDAYGNPIALANSASVNISTQQGLLVAGVHSSSSGVSASFLTLDANGRLRVDAQITPAGIQTVTGTVVVQELPHYEVSYFANDISSSCYHMLIDLNNVSGSYKHNFSANSGIFLKSLHCYSNRTNILDKWSIDLGVVMSTTTSSTNVGFIGIGNQFFLDSNTLHSYFETQQNKHSDLTINSGMFKSIANNYIRGLNDLLSNTTIVDVGGQVVNVEEGDLILRVQRLSSGSGTLSLHYHIMYLVE